MGYPSIRSLTEKHKARQLETHLKKKKKKLGLHIFRQFVAPSASDQSKTHLAEVSLVPTHALSLNLFPWRKQLPANREQKQDGNCTHGLQAASAWASCSYCQVMGKMCLFRSGNAPTAVSSLEPDKGRWCFHHSSGAGDMLVQAVRLPDSLCVCSWCLCCLVFSFRCLQVLLHSPW